MKRFLFGLTIVALLNSALCGASLKETIIGSSVAGAICTTYAEEVGGDVEAFSEMNAFTLKIAEKLGYANDIHDYLANIHRLKKTIEKRLLKIHHTKVNVYNNYCIKVYNGFQKGLAKSQK